MTLKIRKTQKRIYYEKDPGLLFALTMPIIHEDLITDTSLPIITSGNYMVEKKNKAMFY